MPKIAEFYVAGLQHSVGKNMVESGMLKEDSTIRLLRVPENKYDPRAIRIIDSATKAPIGWVPKKCNLLPSELMDKGEKLEAKIVKIDRDSDPWTMVKVVIIHSK